MGEMGDLERLMEYEEVERRSKQLTVENSAVARQLKNVEKNRWRNILPFDHNRVGGAMSAGKYGSDFYINANYIKFDDADNHHCYIATQGPLEETAADFWRMVWAEGADTVVMLCKEEEAGRPKCHRYWPLEEAEKLEPFDCGDFTLTVTLVNMEASDDYDIRELRVKNDKTQEERTVYHYHYKAWPDFGVPDDPQSLVTMRNRIRERSSQPATPHIVHCSAGVGRTGTWCAIDVGLSHKGKRVKDMVQEMREQRIGMVQTPEQFTFVQRVLESDLRDGEEAAARGPE